MIAKLEGHQVLLSLGPDLTERFVKLDLGPNPGGYSEIILLNVGSGHFLGVQNSEFQFFFFFFFGGGGVKKLIFIWV